tara:strand:- start:5370 stop:5951 length:582 start_codon:yes stop_codon:yes gene_type:complete
MIDTDKYERNNIHDSVVTVDVTHNHYSNKLLKPIIVLFVVSMVIAVIGIGITHISEDNSSVDIVEEPPYHKIKFTVSDDDKDCRSDEDYFLVLKVENHDYRQLTAIDCLNGVIQADSWDMSWGEGSANDGGDTYSTYLGLKKSFDKWTTDEFYMFIGRFDDTDERWKTTCKTPHIENGYDVSAEYCGEWYANN